MVTDKIVTIVGTGKNAVPDKIEQLKEKYKDIDLTKDSVSELKKRIEALEEYLGIKTPEELSF